MNYVFSTKNPLRYEFPTHINDLVMDRAEAQTSELFVVVVRPGKGAPLHKHDDTEQIFYVLKGKGSLVIEGEKKAFEVNPSDVVRVPPRTKHTIKCLGDSDLVYLAIDCFIGGRPAAEPTWDSHVKVMCREQGFDYDKIIAAQKAKR